MTANEQFLSASQIDQSAYVAVLEKTNEQMGYWVNSQSTSIATLSTLFTALAIIVAILAGFLAIVIWRQSKEHKEAIKLQLEEQHKNWMKREEIREAEANKRIEASEQRYEDLLEKNKAALKALKHDDQKARERLEETIERLEEARARLPAAGIDSAHTLKGTSLSYSKPYLWSTYRASEVHECSKCGYGYEVPAPDALDYHSYTPLQQQMRYTCPSCGNIDLS